MLEASRLLIVKVIAAVFKTLFGPWIHVPFPAKIPFPGFKRLTVTLFVRSIPVTVTIPVAFRLKAVVPFIAWLLELKLTAQALKETPLFIIPF